MESTVFKKLLLLFFGTMSIVAFADDGKVSLGLTSKQYAAGLNYNGIFKYQNASPSQGKIDDVAIISYNRLKVLVDAKSDHGFKYGGMMRFRADNSSSSGVTDRTMIYVDSKLGKLELGSYPTASYNMRVNSAAIAKGSGGVDGDSQNFLPQNDAYGQNFLQQYFVVTDLMMENAGMVSSNKASYITPDIKGLQFGISFTPDTSILGTTASLRGVDANSFATSHFRNVTDAIIKYSYKIAEVTFIPAFRIQNGQSKYTAEVDRKNPNAWEAGLMLEYKNFKAVGAYEDFRKSGAVITGNATEVKAGGHGYNLGLLFEKERFSTSLTYMQTKRANLFSKNAPNPAAGGAFYTGYNKFEMVSLAGDYTIAPGLLWYNELTWIGTRSAILRGQSSRPSSLKGMVGISGMKLFF